MSVTHLRFGASAVKSRSSLFSAGRLEGSAIVVVGVNALETLLFMPNSCIAVATVFRQADSKSSRFCKRSAILALPPRYQNTWAVRLGVHLLDRLLDALVTLGPLARFTIL